MNAQLTRKPIVKALLAVCVWAAAFSPAFADDGTGAGRFSLTPSIGYFGTVGLGTLLPLPQTADVPDIRVLLETRGPEGGVSLGYAFSRRFELQLALSAGGVRIANDVGIGIGGGPMGKHKVSDAVLWNLGARLLYSPVAGTISPYLAAGFGAAILDTRRLGTKTVPALELGAGMNMQLSSRLRAGIEVLDAVSFFRYFEDFGIAYTAIYSADARSVQHRLGVRLRLGYSFGPGS